MIPASESSQPGREDSPCGGGVRGTTVKMTSIRVQASWERGGEGTAGSGGSTCRVDGSLRGALEMNCHSQC